MNLKIVMSSVLLLLPVALNAHADGSPGQIKFVGQIVESGCEIGRTGTVDFGEHSQQMKLTPKLGLTVRTAGNACRHAIPFTVSFESLSAPGASAVSAADKGVVTVTYM